MGMCGRKCGEAGARRSVVAVNWFYESWYQRIFANRSFDRSPHYLLTEEHAAAASLTQPFPPSRAAPTASHDVPTASTRAGGSPQATAPSRGGSEGRGRGRAASGSRFYARLREHGGAPSIPPSAPPTTGGENGQTEGCSVDELEEQ